MIRVLISAIWRVLAYICSMHLMVRLTGDAADERVNVEIKGSLDDEIERFVMRHGIYSSDWIPVGSGQTPRYVRYDQIVEIRGVPR